MMKAVSRWALAALLFALAPGCGGDVDVAEGAAPAAVAAGQWSLRAVLTASPTPSRAVVAARLRLDRDRTWVLRYDYHVAGTPTAHVWSSGLSGTWEPDARDASALRFAVLDDGSSAVATVRPGGTLDVTLAGYALRFERTPE